MEFYCALGAGTLIHPLWIIPFFLNSGDVGQHVIPFENHTPPVEDLQ